MSVSSLFEFFADNPPTALIAGGILLIVLSVVTGTLDVPTTEFLRNTAMLLIGLGFLLQVLWLVLKYR